MDQIQADEVTEALLAPVRSNLQQSIRKAEERRRALSISRKRSAVALSFAVLGGVAGTVLAGSFRIGGVLGWTLGGLAGIVASAILVSRESPTRP